ncbi:MAG: ROK family protein [Chloroflexota bacterium]
MDMKESVLPVLAIDLGGTKILAAIVSGDGQVLVRERCLTRAEEGVEAVISRMFVAIEGVLACGNIPLSQLGGVSVAAAGPIDMERGVITASPNLPGWSDVPLRDIIRERFKTDTFLINDAKAAALGEHRYGAGRGVKNLIYLTVSTGIGGGIIINDKLYFGEKGSAGELGHMTIDMCGPPCSCGSTGCWEALASGSAMAREMVRRVQCGDRSITSEMVGGNLAEITAETVSRAAGCGDRVALDVILKTAKYLGVGMANIVNIFNPEMIVVGGGVSKMGDLLLAPARRELHERAFRVAAAAVRVVPALLGDENGVLGAAAFAAGQK